MVNDVYVMQSKGAYRLSQMDQPMLSSLLKEVLQVDRPVLKILVLLKTEDGAPGAKQAMQGVYVLPFLRLRPTE